MFQQYPDCRKCNLYKGVRTIGTASSGSSESNLLIIGEANGEQEDLEGYPFIGKSGTLLREALVDAGVDKFVMTNICRCRPPKNRTPMQEEIDACLPYLYEDIAKMPNLKLIVACGNIALRALTGQQKITKVSGEEWELEHDGKKYKLMPVVHPAYVLLNPVEKDKFFDHIQRIPRILLGDMSSKDDFGEYTYLTTFQQVANFFEELRKKKVFSYDLETNGLNPFKPGAIIKCIQFSFELKSASVLPLGIWSGDQWEWIKENLKSIFESKQIGKVGQNIKFDNLWLLGILGIDVHGTVWDTKIVEYLLYGKGSTGLKELAWRYSKLGGYEKRLEGKVEEVENGENLWFYGAVDADLTFRIMKQQYPKLQQRPGLYYLNKNLMVPISEVFHRMEAAGVLVDRPKVDIAGEKVITKIEELIKEMRAEDSIKAFESEEGDEFNPNSSKQLQYILYKLEGLPVIKRTDKGKAPSTDKEVLTFYKDQNHLCHLLYEYSAYSQIKKTFIKELEEYTTPDNRLRSTFWLTETVTGRTSSKHPNMQNMPKGEKDILNIREVFIADPDYLLAEFDMNQHELRVMAEESGDANMLEALKGDVHKETTASVLNISPDAVTSEQRRLIGKTLNFGLIYGLSKYGLMNQLKISDKEAELFLARFFKKYEGVRKYQDHIKEEVRRTGKLETRSGRYRQFPKYEDWEFEDKIKEAINYPIQSIASDILLYGAIGVDKLLRGRKSFLCLEVHDSLLINLHKTEMLLIPEIKHIMCDYFKEFMPWESELKVDLKIGKNWGNMEDIK